MSDAMPPEFPDPNLPPVPPPPPPAAPGGYGAPPPPPPPPPPPAYGPPPPGYAAPPAGYAAPAGMDPAGVPFADWGSRAIGILIDSIGPFIVAGLLSFVSSSLGLLAYLAAIGWTFYNRYLEGTTGQSYGKKTAGTRLVSATTGQPIGAGLAIARHFVHIVDTIICYVGWLFPLWDAKKQTLADKIMTTYVVKA